MAVRAGDEVVAAGARTGHISWMEVYVEQPAWQHEPATGGDFEIEWTDDASKHGDSAGGGKVYRFTSNQP